MVTPATLLPVLEAAFPSFRQTVARSARHAAQAQGLLDQLAAVDAQATGLPPHVRALQSLRQDRQANVLRYWLAQDHQIAASEAQMRELLKQIAACTTRGHRLHLKVARGYVERVGAVLQYLPEHPPV